MITHANEIGVTCVLHHCRWTPGSLRGAYDAILDAWARAGVPANRAAAKAPGVSKQWGSFAHKRRHIESTDFGAIEWMNISHVNSGADKSDSESIAYAYLNVSRHCCLTWIPSLIGASASNLDDLVKELARIGKAKYGYTYMARWHIQNRGLCMFLYSHESYEEYAREQPLLLLHDVFPANYLSAAYLEAPVGLSGQSLRQWIEADANKRGALAPYAGSLLVWTPPVDRIPEIREELYRRGRVFDSRFFSDRCYWEGHATAPKRSNPHYRPNILEPWEAPEPVPKVFCADFYRDKDPGLVYWRNAGGLPLQ